MKKILILILALLTGSSLRPQEPYQEWKKNKQKFLISMGVGDPLEQSIQLLSDIRELRAGASNDTLEELHYLYTFLLDLIKPSSIHSPDDIDWQWIYDLEEEMLTLRSLEDESLREEGLERAAGALRDVLLRVKKEFHITKPLGFFSFNNEGCLQTSYYLALSRQGNMNSWIATAYHEMTHILYDDSFNRNRVRAGEIAANTLLDDPSLQKTKQLTDHYIHLGKQLFDHTTRIGQEINRAITTHTSFYKAPKNPRRYAYYMLIRAQEQRADLSEINKLLEHGLMDALWQEIDYYTFLHSDAGGEYNPWPADIERALCIAGFLNEQGIDVNNQLRTWEKKKCPAAPISDISFDQPSEGMQDAQNAYFRWRHFTTS